MPPEEIIHFAHANSFPARTYNKLFSLLADRFEIRYLERHGHNPRFPVSDGWFHLKEELKAEIEKNYARKIIGVGHSLGGILHFLVAVERPELYKAIVLLDAPLVSPLSGAGLRVLRRTKLIERLPLLRATNFRRAHWPSKEAAFEHFRQKEKFASFDERVLRDYVEHGTTAASTAAAAATTTAEDDEGDSGVRLFFDPRVEAEIYRTIPHDFSRHRGKLQVPAAYVGGTRSREARLARLGFMRRHFPIRFYFLDGGSHLFPLEKPEETARLIETAVNDLLA